MLKTQIYLDITENMSIFDVGELQNLRFTRVVATRHEKTLTPIVSKRLKNNKLFFKDESGQEGSRTPTPLTGQQIFVGLEIPLGYVLTISFDLGCRYIVSTHLSSNDEFSTALLSFIGLIPSPI